jgi:hypothetical protein
MTLIMIGFGIGCIVGGVFVLTLGFFRKGREYAKELESKLTITRCKVQT